MRLYANKWDAIGYFGLGAFIIAIIIKYGIIAIDKFQSGTIAWFQPAFLVFIFIIAILAIRSGVLVLKYASIPIYSVEDGIFSHREYHSENLSQMPLKDIYFAERVYLAGKSTAWGILFTMRDGSCNTLQIGDRKTTDRVVENILEAIANRDF